MNARSTKQTNEMKKRKKKTIVKDEHRQNTNEILPALYWQYKIKSHFSQIQKLALTIETGEI